MNYNLDGKYPFEKITLANPSGLQGGSYFSKLNFEDDELLFQTPKCLTKNGIHKTGKKIYTDLQLTFDDSVFINWIENLEERIRDLIYEKRLIWFNNEPDREEIEYNWNSSLRTYKQKYQLLRVYVPNLKNSNNEHIQIWNDEQNVLSLDDIQSKNRLINIVEITGLKFTNQSFHLEYLIRQIMVFKEKKTFNKCLISLDNSTYKKINEDLETEDVDLETEDVDLETDKADNNLAKYEKKDLEKNEKAKIIQLAIRRFLERKKIKKNLEHNNEMALKIQTWWKKKELKDLEKIVEIPIAIKPLEQITEAEISIPVENEIIKLRKPEEVYLNIYKEAKQKAKEAKIIAIKAYLEAKRIKKTYLIDEIDSSESDDE